MYITEFALISSMALEIEALFVRSQSIQKKNKRTFRTQIKCDVENLRRNPLGN